MWFIVGFAGLFIFYLALSVAKGGTRIIALNEKDDPK